MTRRKWQELCPDLIVGLGIVAATLVAAIFGESRWLVLAGPLLLALAVLGAEALSAQAPGKRPGVSVAAWMLSGSIVLGGLILALDAPLLVKTFLPFAGVSAWVTRFIRSQTQCARCGLV